MKKSTKKQGIETVATKVTLESMRAWCEEHENVIATQKGNGVIRIYGESYPYRKELTQMGFRWARDKAFWWHRPTM